MGKKSKGLIAMEIRLTEERLHNLIYECVRNILIEGEGKTGLQSQKLYDIIKQYGGFNKESVRPASFDVHNITDNDVIGVFTDDDLRRAKATVIGQGRYRDEIGLNAWAQKMGYEIIPGDAVEPIPLGDYKHSVVVIVRNLYQANGREGEGWDKTNQMVQKRSDDKSNDGKNRYIPKYKRPWAWDRQWKNSYKKGNTWTRDDIEKDMQSIRDEFAKGDERKRNY